MRKKRQIIAYKILIYSCSFFLLLNAIDTNRPFGGFIAFLMVMTTWIIGLLWRNDRAYDRWFISKFKRKIKKDSFNTASPEKFVKKQKVEVSKKISSGFQSIWEKFIYWLNN